MLSGAFNFSTPSRHSPQLSAVLRLVPRCHRQVPQHPDSRTDTMTLSAGDQPSLLVCFLLSAKKNLALELSKFLLISRSLEFAPMPIWE